MGKFISFGIWLPSYKYVLFLVIFNVAKDLSFGSHEVEYFPYLKAFDSGLLNDSHFIHEIFCYFTIFVVGCILFKKEDQNINRNSIEYSFKKLENKMTENQTLDIELIHNEQEIESYPTIYLFIIIFFWVLNEQALYYFNSIFIHMDFWMIELIILTFFMRKLLNLKLYRHQWATIGLIFIPFSLKIGTMIISGFDEKNNLSDENDYKYDYKQNIDNCDPTTFPNKLKIIYIAKKARLLKLLVFSF